MKTMSTPRPTPGDIVRESVETARHLAETARLHHEPEVAERFEQIAAAGEARARHLDELAEVIRTRHHPEEGEPDV
jgi:hypothetical protein